MFDRAMGEEGPFVGQRDDQLDCCLEIAAGEIVWDVDADAGLAYVARVKDVEGAAAHDLDFPERGDHASSAACLTYDLRAQWVDATPPSHRSTGFQMPGP